MVKKRGLGKSLDALLAYTGPDATHTETEAETPAGLDGIRQMDVTQIQRGKYQPRRDIDPASLDDLANSIRSQGVIQPLIVRPVGDDKYEIIAGERRWRAAQLAGLDAVPVIVRHIPDEAAIAIALIENIQRENLNPIEEAIALQRLIDEFGMTHQQAADAVGKNRATISNLLRLLALPEEVKNMLERGQIEMGHARTLITLPEAVQLEAASVIVARQLSVRETETLVRQLQAGEPANTKSTKAMDPDILHLQNNLSKQLRMKVAIKCNAKGRGKLIIHYRNLTELDDLLAQFEPV
jgi:ParB family chromosome partitioning protein